MLDYSVLINELKNGNAVLVASNEHNIPTIHNVGQNGPIRTDTEVIHCGFGLFKAEVDNETITFDAGGAMRRPEGKYQDYSYTILRASSKQLESMGYDIDSVLATLETQTR